jgi:hypothetical protein
MLIKLAQKMKKLAQIGSHDKGAGVSYFSI